MGAEEYLHFEFLPSSQASGGNSSTVPSNSPLPIVLLHGLFGSGSNVISLARLFLSERDVYLVDLPNHGRSPWTDNASYQSASAMLHRTLGKIAQTIGRERTQSFHIYGHSMGGKVVMCLALLQEELRIQEEENYQLRSIIIGDIAPRRYQPGHEKYFKAMKEMPMVESRAEADEYMSAFVENPVLRSFLLKNLDRDGNSNRFCWKINLDTLIKDYEQILDWPLDTNLKAQIPALFLRGVKSDYILPSRDRNCIWGYFPLARLEEIPDSAHWIHSEQTQTVYQLISRFFSA